MPGRISACLDFDVVDFTKQASSSQRRDSKVIGRVAQREVTAATKDLLRQRSRMMRASCRVSPIGFWISTAALSGRCGRICTS